MNKFIHLSIVLLLFSCTSSPQNEASKTSENKEIKKKKPIPEEASDCIYEKSGIQFDTIWLYRESKTIVLNSYKFPMNSLEFEENLSEKEIKKKREEFNKENTLETVKINKIQKDSLFNLLLGFNISSSIDFKDCDEPRHSITFLNNQNKQIGIISICFTCNQTSSTIELFKYICRDQLEFYADYLKWCGIKESYGHFRMENN